MARVQRGLCSETVTAALTAVISISTVLGSLCGDLHPSQALNAKPCRLAIAQGFLTRLPRCWSEVWMAVIRATGWRKQPAGSNEGPKWPRRRRAHAEPSTACQPHIAISALKTYSWTAGNRVSERPSDQTKCAAMKQYQGVGVKGMRREGNVQSGCGTAIKSGGRQQQHRRANA